jgi:Rieske 2Fe-2S family protein
MRTTPAAVTLPGRYYTSPEVFGTERRQIFARAWTAVCRADALSAAGDFVMVDVAGESLLVTRGEDGRIRAFYNVCRHRGTQLCERSAGRFPGAITCPYHAWTYGLEGSLRVARNMQGADGFAASDYPLHEVETDAAAGFVFVRLERPNDAASLLDFLHPLRNKLERWNLAGLASVRSIQYELACNWKLVVQNYSECYHCPIIHPQLDKLSPWDSGSNDLIDGALIGGPMTLRPTVETMSLDGTGARPPLGNVGDEDLRRVYYYAIFPGLLLSLHPDYVMVHRVDPLGVERSRVTCEWLFDRTTAETESFDPSHAIEFWDLTNRQDWHICELSQRGVASRAYAPGPYSPYESMLRAFDAHYLTSLGSPEACVAPNASPAE